VILMIFKLDKIHHFGVVVSDLEKSVEHYWEELGIGPWNIWTYAPPLNKETTFYGKPVEYKFRIAETTIGNVNLELMMHLEGETLYKQFLARHGEGLQHIGYATNDIESALQNLKEAGISVIQGGKYGKDSYYYLDTESKFGFVMELVTTYYDIPPERTYPSK
jgi:methylmalonyl-CoA/ethylmalonyl-CoA epimerase